MYQDGLASSNSRIQQLRMYVNNIEGVSSMMPLIYSGSVSPAVDVAEATPKQLEDTVAMPTKSTEPEATSSDVVQETSSEKPPRKKR